MLTFFSATSILPETLLAEDERNSKSTLRRPHHSTIATRVMSVERILAFKTRVTSEFHSLERPKLELDTDFTLFLTALHPSMIALCHSVTSLRTMFHSCALLPRSGSKAMG